MRKVRALEDALATYSLKSDNLHVAVEALRELLGADKAFLYSFAQRVDGDDLVVTRAHAAHSVPPPAVVDYASELADFLRGRGVDWGGYNVLRPEPEHRDRVLRTSEITELVGGRDANVETELYTRLGLAGQDTMRVLVCDGPHMLAWLGIIQEKETTDQQRALLERLVPAFRRRLLFERQIHQSRISDSALGLVLEELPSAAWVLAAGGVEYANAAGHARLEADRVELTRALRAAGAPSGGRREESSYRVARRRDALGAPVTLVVETSQGYGATDITHVVGRLGLTPAQARVFERLARGASNATIAAELGIAERTVEAHVTAILVKAQVPNRATLIVRIFEGARALAAVPGEV